MPSGIIRACAFLAALGSVVWLQGCSTPQPLLDQANNGAMLTMSLQAEMDRFRSVRSEIAQHRLDSIRRQLTSLSTYQIESDFDERVKKAAGTATTTQLYTDLRTLADSRVADEKLLAQQMEQVDTELGKVLAPLPDTVNALQATQKTLAVMGEELSMTDRLSTVASFSKDIKAGIEDNKKKIDDAKKETAIAPVQPPSASGN
jgi:hypothetical protein